MFFSKKIKKWPNFRQWKYFFKVLSKKEKIYFSIFVLIFFNSLIFLISHFYLKNTQSVPKYGGIYTEGLIGQPRFINPIYANSDVDRDLTNLIFSGLMKYDDNLQIIPDLVQNYEIEEDGLIYKFYLKDKIFWQDKTPLTTDDVVFTIKTIQNPEYKSPLRANWIGVEVEKISELGVKFKLRKPYAAFLENCTVKILPKHIWENIPAENFALEFYNLEPIGSGPYKLKEIKQEKNGRTKFITLNYNHLYYGQKPYIPEIKFFFFNNEKELINAAQTGKIKGLSSDSYKNPGGKWQVYYFSLPRYFAIFFNPEKNKILSEKNIRIALNYGTNKRELAEKIFNLPKNSSLTEKIIAESPILPKIYGLEKPSKIYDFDPEKAKKLLEDAGFKDENGDGLRDKKVEKKPAFQFKSVLKIKSQGTEVRELQKCLAKFPDIYPEGEITGYFGKKTEKAVIKFQEKYRQEILEPSGLSEGNGLVKENTRNKLNEICFDSSEEILSLKFVLVTVDQPKLVETAKKIKEQWKLLGVEIEIQQFSISQLEQDFIKPRNYEMLLFGEVLGAIPDPLPFWHSSQIIDPGLNLANYKNKETDKLLEDIRRISEPEIKTEKLVNFQNFLISDAPAIFLYSPDYIYLISKEIKGINIKKIVEPSKRFSGIENWYIKTKRVWK